MCFSYVKYKVLTEENMDIKVFWAVTACDLVDYHITRSHIRTT
jgi:hypothetical protein